MRNLPNILFLFSDQHNAKCMSNTGYSDVKTPNMDRLAERGVRFTNAFCQNPVCTPSRISFLTGQYCHNHGYYDLFGPIPLKLYSMFEHFRKFGYRTAAIGKLHTPFGWLEKHCDFADHLYGEFAGESKGSYDLYLEKLGIIDDSRIYPLAGKPTIDSYESEVPLEHSIERFTTKRAVDFLDSIDTDQPWMMWVSHYRPHKQTSPSKPFGTMYDPGKLKLPPNYYDTLEGKPERQKQHRDFARSNVFLYGLEPEAAERRFLAHYLGLVSQVDESIGILLDEVERRAGLDNTIIVYASDHGDFAAEHGMVEKVYGISYDAVDNIPLIISGPGKIREGSVCNELVEAVDVFPTFCDLAGIPTPDCVQGKSLKPFLNGENTPQKDAAFTENAWTKSIRTKEWRLVYHPYEDSGELYDMVNDRWQLRNLYNNESYERIKIELQKKLLDWLITTTRPVTYFSALALGERLDYYSRNTGEEDGKVSYNETKVFQCYR